MSGAPEEEPVARAPSRSEHELRRTRDAFEEETRILELLNRTGSMIASSLELETVVQAVTDAGRELTGAEFGAFFYTATNEEGGVFTLYTLSGASREAFAGFRHPRATDLFAPTFRGEGVIRIGDVRADPRYGKWGPHHGMPKGHLPVRSYLAIPVVGRTGEVLGGLFFGHHEPDRFTERAERLIVGVATHAAIAIDNARLYEEQRRAAAERARLLEIERAARAEVERASLVKDDFLATVSHELRTPLNAILGWAQILGDRFDGGTEEARGLEIIRRNARAQAQLIEDLLDMSRIVAGKIRLEPQTVDLAATVRAAVDSARPAAASRGVAIHVAVEGAPSVVGDPARLQQVVSNLLSNAVKFTPRGGSIDVSVATNDVDVDVLVRDSGEGIAPEILPFVFDRFRQGDPSSTRKHGGLGLGLAIVKQLVEMHGGVVRAASDGVGRGATFVVTLPARGDRVSTAVPVAPKAAPSLAGLTVLVVDDDPDARDLLAFVLEDAGATVVLAASVDEAMAAVRRGPPDVVVSDIGMPDRDGYDFIRELRTLPPSAGGRAPAVALTAFARSDDRARAAGAGFSVHVPKPVDPRELVTTIGRLVDRRTPVHPALRERIAVALASHGAMATTTLRGALAASTTLALVALAACSSTPPPAQIPEPAPTTPASADIAPNNAPPTSSAATQSAPPPTPEAPPAPPPLTDEQILQVTHLANAGEVEQAKIAQKKAKSPKVKQLAGMMIKDHGDADKKGTDLAKKNNLTPADSPVSQQLASDAKNGTDGLSAPTGADFDKAYVDLQVKEHQAVLSIINDKLMPAAKNADVKAFLAEVKPKIEMHLQHAQEVQKDLAK